MDSKPQDSVPSETEVSSTPNTPPRKKTSSKNWQERLLPVMIGILVGLTIFFFITTFIQLVYLNSNILQIPDLDLRSSAGMVPASVSAEEQMAARKQEYLAALEAYVVARRYHQASVSLTSSLWLRYLGFVTGMILALVGASFILGKLQEPTSEITGKWSAIDFSLKSASPGIILAMLGVVLMFATIVDHDEITVTDRPTYFTGVSIGGSSSIGTPMPPILSPLDLPTLSPTPPSLGK